MMSRIISGGYAARPDVHTFYYLTYLSCMRELRITLAPDEIIGTLNIFCLSAAPKPSVEGLPSLPVVPCRTYMYARYYSCGKIDPVVSQLLLRIQDQHIAKPGTEDASISGLID